MGKCFNVIFEGKSILPPSKKSLRVLLKNIYDHWSYSNGNGYHSLDDFNGRFHFIYTSFLLFVIFLVFYVFIKFYQCWKSDYPFKETNWSYHIANFLCSIHTNGKDDAFLHQKCRKHHFLRCKDLNRDI